MAAGETSAERSLEVVIFEGDVEFPPAVLARRRRVNGRANQLLKGSLRSEETTIPITFCLYSGYMY
jgi:hypothetical protein